MKNVIVKIARVLKNLVRDEGQDLVEYTLIWSPLRRLREQRLWPPRSTARLWASVQLLPVT